MGLPPDRMWGARPPEHGRLGQARKRLSSGLIPRACCGFASPPAPAPPPGAEVLVPIKQYQKEPSRIGKALLYFQVEPTRRGIRYCLLPRAPPLESMVGGFDNARAWGEPTHTSRPIEQISGDSGESRCNRATQLPFKECQSHRKWSFPWPLSRICRLRFCPFPRGSGSRLRRYSPRCRPCPR